MALDFIFFFNSLLLGVGLAMDAFSVSLANGLHEPRMKIGKMSLISGIFGIFQGIMPLLGWICVHTIAHCFAAFEAMIPWIALALLSFIGAKMVLDSLHPDEDEGGSTKLGLTALLVQGVATSIDALSVGFTIADYDLPAALIAVAMIAAVTFVICFAGLAIGRKMGTRLAARAGIFGGVILILIGIEIFVTSFF